MAELILTDEERAAALWTDLDDVALGRLLRKQIAVIGTAAGQLDRVTLDAAALLLCCGAAECNADEMNFAMDGVTQAGRPFGDWTVTVRRRRGAVAPVPSEVERMRTTHNVSQRVLRLRREIARYSAVVMSLPSPTTPKERRRKTIANRCLATRERDLARALNGL